MYLKEEENHVKQLLNTFTENWQGISIIGDKFVSEMIGLLQDGQQIMSKEFSKTSILQTRSVSQGYRLDDYSL